MSSRTIPRKLLYSRMRTTSLKKRICRASHISVYTYLIMNCAEGSGTQACRAKRKLSIPFGVPFPMSCAAYSMNVWISGMISIVN